MTPVDGPLLRQGARPSRNGEPVNRAEARLIVAAARVADRARTDTEIAGRRPSTSSAPPRPGCCTEVDGPGPAGVTRACRPVVPPPAPPPRRSRRRSSPGRRLGADLARLRLLAAAAVAAPGVVAVAWLVLTLVFLVRAAGAGPRTSRLVDVERRAPPGRRRGGRRRPSPERRRRARPCRGRRRRGASSSPTSTRRGHHRARSRGDRGRPRRRRLAVGPAADDSADLRQQGPGPSYGPDDRAHRHQTPRVTTSPTRALAREAAESAQAAERRPRPPRKAAGA